MRTASLFSSPARGLRAESGYREGLDLIDADKTEAGLAKLEEATARTRRTANTARRCSASAESALQRYLALAETARQQGQWDSARIYRRMLAITQRPARPRRARGGRWSAGIARSLPARKSC